MTLPSVESTPEVPHSRVARVEEYHWFFVQFQHFSAPKYKKKQGVKAITKKLPMFCVTSTSQLSEKKE